jgi:glycosyltransferase involved in cell wall biosynthesis
VVSNPYVAPPEEPPVRRHGNGNEPLSLLFVGRLIREKGIFEALDAFAAISESHDCRMVLVGDGPEAPAIAQRVAELGLQDRVGLAGFFEGRSLHDVYSAADIFVFPSYREGFPTAVTEAMAAGLPVITTRTRGMADHLAPERNALLVQPRDTAALIVALRRILDDPELRARMSAANSEKVAEFAPKAVARQYLDTLKELTRS